MADGDPSLTDWAVAGVLAEAPAHGFELARTLAREGELGVIWSVRRAQIYRALDHLVERTWAQPLREEPGRGGPTRQVHAITSAGRAAVNGWLVTPVPRLRDVRHALLLKLALTARRGMDPAPLLRAQREEARAMLAGCEADAPETPTDALVVAWRRESAQALLRLLDAFQR